MNETLGSKSAAVFGAATCETCWRFSVRFCALQHHIIIIIRKFSFSFQHSTKINFHDGPARGLEVKTNSGTHFPRALTTPHHTPSLLPRMRFCIHRCQVQSVKKDNGERERTATAIVTVARVATLKPTKTNMQLTLFAHKHKQSC